MARRWALEKHKSKKRGSRRGNAVTGRRRQGLEETGGHFPPGLVARLGRTERFNGRRWPLTVGPRCHGLRVEQKA